MNELSRLHKLRRVIAARRDQVIELERERCTPLESRHLYGMRQAYEAALQDVKQVIGSIIEQEAAQCRQ